jgi:hypothetical protein
MADSGVVQYNPADHLYTGYKLLSAGLIWENSSGGPATGDPVAPGRVFADNPGPLQNRFSLGVNTVKCGESVFHKSRYSNWLPVINISELCYCTMCETELCCGACLLIMALLCKLLRCMQYHACRSMRAARWTMRGEERC